MPDYQIHPASDLAPIGALYAEVGFRADLVEDLGFLRGVGGAVFVASAGREIVGASSCLPFGASGWVGGVAVRSDHRGNGLGTRLTTTAMRALGARPISLFATDDARPLYERLGFVAEMGFVELHGESLPGAPEAAVRPATARDLDAAAVLDRAATGEDRGRLLAELWSHEVRLAVSGSGLVGFSLPQSPTSAGAVIATEPAAGRALLSAALTRLSGSARIGVPAEHADLLADLLAAGCRVTARTTRMRLGPVLDWRPERIFATFNLYWG